MKVLRRSALVLAFTLTAAAMLAAATERGVLISASTIYISPDAHSTKLADVERGREVAILEKSRDWVHVLASVTAERDVTGWILDQGLIRASTPNGDQIMYGEGVNSENEASRRHGRKGADKDAYRLYRMTAEYFPNSPLAGEALYRAADIRWQLDREDMLGRPSAKERDPMMRHQMDEDLMKEVIKKFRGTKWADLAAFHLLENKVCGDWQGQSKCPEKEADLYEKYVVEHPQSPAAAEALYNAATRYSALIEIYKSESQPAKSEQAKNKVLALTQRITSQFPPGDWVARARTLQYLTEQGIPTYAKATADSGVSEFRP